MAARIQLLACAALLAVTGCGDKGTDGKNGARSLVRLDPIPAGATCPAGGTAIASGVDGNGNGTLDEGEVVSTQTLCSGGSQPGTLTRVVAEPAGVECASGGQRIESGPDANANGVLDDGEVTTTQYVCRDSPLSDGIAGSVTIASQEDLAKVQGVALVVGDVVVTPEFTGTLSWPALQNVWGGLYIDSGSDGLTEIDLPSVSYLEDLEVEDQDGLTRISLPNLRTVDDTLEIEGNPALSSLDLSALDYVYDLYVEDDDALTKLELPSLVDVDEQLSIYGNQTLAQVSLPKLSDVDYLSIVGNPKLPECPLFKLAASIGANGYLGGSEIDGNDTTVACVPGDYCTDATFSGIPGTFHQCVQPLAWADAEAACETLGGGTTLATFESLAEWEAFRAVKGGLYGWIGYSDVATEGTWAPAKSGAGFMPTNSSSTNATFWDSPEPNGGSTENCVEIYRNGVANDNACGSEHPFICRSPAAP